MSFDIAKLDTRAKSEAGVAMPVRHPRTGAPLVDPDTGTPITITLLGRVSDKFRAAQREAQTRQAQFQARGVTLTEEDYERERQNLLCAATIGWTFDKMDGEPFPYSEDNARRFWADRRWSWLAPVAMAFVQEDGNFLAD